MAIDSFGIEGFAAVNENILSLDNAEIFQRWQTFSSLFEIYSHSETNPNAQLSQQLSDWPQRYAFKKRMGMLQNGFAALNELSANESLSEDDKERIKKVIVAKINITLKEFELAQTKLLQRFQHIVRLDTEAFNHEIMQDRKRYYMELRNLTFELDKAVLPSTHRFIKHEKNKFHLSEKIPYMQKIATGVGFGSGILQFIERFTHGLHALGMVLSAIPVVSAITTAVPMVVSAARSWLKNKSPAKKTFATVLAVLAVGVIISVGLGTVATGGMVAGLITLGVIKNQIMPWWKIRQNLKEKQALVDEINEREKTIHHSPITSLTLSEKQMLLHRLEQQYLNASPQAKSSLMQTMKLITSSNNIDVIRSDLNMKSLLKDKTLESFISESNKSRLVTLNADLKQLKAKEMDSRIGMFNGLLGIAGSILMCIPTPPTIILGASLLITNSIVGLALHFDLPNKFRNFFSKKAAPHKKPVIFDESEFTDRPANRLSNEHKMRPHESTSDVIDHLHIPTGVVAKNHSPQSRQETKPLPSPSNDAIFLEPTQNKIGNKKSPDDDAAGERFISHR